MLERAVEKVVMLPTTWSSRPPGMALATAESRAAETPAARKTETAKRTEFQACRLETRRSRVVSWTTRRRSWTARTRWEERPKANQRQRLRDGAMPRRTARGAWGFRNVLDEGLGMGKGAEGWGCTNL